MVKVVVKGVPWLCHLRGEVARAPLKWWRCDDRKGKTESRKGGVVTGLGSGWM